MEPRELPDLNKKAHTRGEVEPKPVPADPLLCEHELEPTGEEFLTQLDNLSRLTRFVKCKKCGIEAMDVFVYIGTYNRG